MIKSFSFFFHPLTGATIMTRGICHAEKKKKKNLGNALHRYYLAHALFPSPQKCPLRRKDR